jgi:hypothetical protein
VASRSVPFLLVLALLVPAGVLGGACAGISNRLAHPSQSAGGPLAVGPTAAEGSVRSEDPTNEHPVGVAQRFERPDVAPTPRTWRTLTTEHFITHTDAVGPRPADVLAYLERIRASLAPWFDTDPVAMEIILFGSQVDYLRRFPGSVALQVDMSTAQEVVITHLGHDKPTLDELLDQALVLRFVQAKFGRLPSWLSDGIVTHFGTARLQEDRLFLGAPPPSLGIDKELGDIAPLQELFAADDPDVEPLSRRTKRTTAWALVGYLLDESVWGASAADRFRAWVAMAGRSGATSKSILAGFADIYPERSLAAVSAGYSAHARGTAGTHRYQHSLEAPAQPAPSIATVPITLDRITPVLNKAREELAGARPVDPRETQAVARWRDEKPVHQMRIALDWAEPTATYGLAYGYSFVRDHSIDIEVGRTPLGHFLTTRYRADFEVENARNLFINLAVGPTIALKNTLFGLNEPPPPTDPNAPAATTSFYHLAVSGELAVGAFFWRGFHMRASLTVLRKLGTNLDEFCTTPEYRHNPACPETGRMASDDWTGYIRLGGGYAW